MSRGFSILELLIAMAVLLSAFTVIVLISSSQNTSIDAQQASEALASARHALETEQSLARKDFKLVVASSSPGGVSGIQSTTAITVEQLDFFTKKVTATVSWQESYGRSGKITLPTIVTNFTNAIGGDTCSTVLTDKTGAHSDWKNPLSATFTLPALIGGAATAPYGITDVDAYQGRLYAVGTSTPAPVPANPGTVQDAGGGQIAWSNINNVKVKDGVNATLATNSTRVSNLLKATGFNFSIPLGATITGIRVDIYRNASGNSGTNAVIDSKVQIIKDGVVGAANKASSAAWSTTPQTDAAYGGPGDFWNETDWSPTKINSANFGVAFAVTGNSSSANRTAQVDSVQITVYYTKSFYIFDAKEGAFDLGGAPTKPVWFAGGLATSTISGGYNAVAVATSSSMHYAYTATASSTAPLQIIDVKDPTRPFVTATYASTTVSGIGTAIFYKDGYAYLGRANATGPEFNIIDVSNPYLPKWMGGYSVGKQVNAITVKDGYAYISTDDTTRDFILLNVSNPAAPSFAGKYDAQNTSGFGFGRGLYTVGDTVYFGRSWTNSGSIPQLLMLDASTTPVILANAPNSKIFPTNMSVRDIVVRDSLLYALTGSGVNGGQLAVVNATSTASVSTPFSSASGIGGVALDCEGNYLYAASDDAGNIGAISVITGH